MYDDDELPEISESELTEFSTFPSASSGRDADKPLARIQQIPRTLKILVAEDNEMNQKVLMALMQAAPVEATFVWNGQEALDAIDTEQFDAALVDIDMPIMCGNEAVRMLRKREESSQAARLPIIACTASTGFADIAQIMDAGFDKYLPKPINFDCFADCLHWINEQGEH